MMVTIRHEAIVSMMQHHADQVDLLTHALLVLIKMSWQNKDGATRIFEAGGVQLMVRLMKQHVDQWLLQYGTSTVISNTVIDNQSYLAAFGEAGGMDVIMDSIRRYLSHFRTLKQLLGTLGDVVHGNEAHKARFFELGGADLVVDMRYEQPDSLAQVFRVVRNIALGDQNDLETFIKAGFLDSIIRAIRLIPQRIRLPAFKPIQFMFRRSFAR